MTATTHAAAQRIDPSAMSAMRTFLINGDFEYWQRGIGPFTAAQFSADEWQLRIGSGCTLSVAKNNTSPKFGTNCAQVAAVKGAGSVSLRQGVEAYQRLSSYLLSFSMWIKCSTPNCVYLSISDYNGSTIENNVSSYHTGSGDWELLTVIYEVRNSLVTSSEGPHGFGLWVDVGFNLSDASTLLDGGMLVTGGYPEGVGYVPEDMGLSFAKCQRFYQSGTALFGDWVVFSGNTTSGVTYRATRVFNTPMFNVPTVVLADQGNNGFGTRTASAATTGMQVVGVASSTSSGNWFYNSWTAEV